MAEAKNSLFGDQTTYSTSDAPSRQGLQQSKKRRTFGWSRAFCKHRQAVILALSLTFFSIGCVMMIWPLGPQNLISKGPRFQLGTALGENAHQQAPTTETSSLYHHQENKSHDSVASSHLVSDASGTKDDVTFVDYAVSGNKVKFSDALSRDYPFSVEEEINYRLLEKEEERETNRASNETDVRLLIGVTTAACSELSRRRRDGIRNTWMQNALNMSDTVTVRFFVGQPETCSFFDMQKLKDEIEENHDFFVVRGDDSYDNLANKTLGLLKYVLSAPERYTHVLKTDDDTYIRMHQLLDALDVDGEKRQMKQVYKGLVENWRGFRVCRDPSLKFYFSREYFSDDTAAEIEGTVYTAGFGYVLSRDLMFHAMKKVYAWNHGQMPVPKWHNKFKMLDDVMMGVLMSDVVKNPDSDERFRAPWQGCPSKTAVIHLDVDSPRLLRGLYEQEQSGVWELKEVVCNSGNYHADNYSAWVEWRSAVYSKIQHS